MHEGLSGKVLKPSRIDILSQSQKPAPVNQTLEPVKQEAVTIAAKTQQEKEPATTEDKKTDLK